MSQNSWIHVGFHGDYHWLEMEGDVRIGYLVAAFPELVYQRYVAITASQGDAPQLIEEEKAAGWELRGDIAYSPQVLESNVIASHHFEGEPGQGADEWYVFDSLRDLGERHAGDPFLEPPSEKRPFVFANFGPFRLNPEDAELDFVREWFWGQIDWMKPEAYLAQGGHRTIVVTKDGDLLERVVDCLYDIAS